MNKISIINNKLKQKLDDSIIIDVVKDESPFAVNKIIINIVKDTDLIINYKNKEFDKCNIIFNILKNITFNLFEYRSGFTSKIQNIINMEENSNVYVFKINDVKEIKERTFINLNGIKANINYNFKTISKNNEEYDFIINHKYSDTISNLSLNGVNIRKGTLSFNITGDVQKGRSNCILNQESRIINLNNNKCIIKPNMLIDEYNVTANHSALIGKLDQNELFYLQSRGIPLKQAINLLIKGLLIKKLIIFDEKETIDKIINKYWR